MTSRARTVAIAAVAGVLAAAGSIGGGIWLRGALAEDAEPVDGEFVLDQPGIYQEPTTGANDDATGELVPDVVLTDADGATVRLSEYRGAPLVVNVWFSRCVPCKRELVDFATVHAEVADRVQFVGVDPDDDAATMLSFAAERGVTYDLLLDDREEFVDAAGIALFPVTLFVDAEGRVLRQTGALDADALRDAIEELF